MKNDRPTKSKNPVLCNVFRFRFSKKKKTKRWFCNFVVLEWRERGVLDSSQKILSEDSEKIFKILLKTQTRNRSHAGSPDQKPMHFTSGNSTQGEEYDTQGGVLPSTDGKLPRRQLCVWAGHTEVVGN